VSDYKERTFFPHLRITILRLLSEAAGYQLNDSILREAAEHLGLSATRDQVRGQLGWLEELGLVTVRALDALKVATLTEAGHDVASGKRRVDGVKRPGP
jgi:hypothetical protein